VKESLLNKLNNLLDRHEEIAGLLADPDVIGDQNQFRDLSKEYAQLEPVLNCYQDYTAAKDNLKSAEEMLGDKDPEMHDMAVEEKAAATEQLGSLEIQLQMLLLPKDPHDSSNIFLEIRAGTGGDEAAIFAGDLFRMYSRYAEERRWKVEILSQNEGEHGGYKEIIARIIGEGAYSRLKFESGAHRVQRVPETESQGPRALRLVDECRIVENELLQGIPQALEIVSLRGEETRIHHRVGLGVTGEGMRCRAIGAGDGVTHPDLADLLQGASLLAAHAEPQLQDRFLSRLEMLHGGLDSVPAFAGQHAGQRTRQTVVGNGLQQPLGLSVRAAGIERRRLFPHGSKLVDLRDRNLHPRSDLLRRRRATEARGQVLAGELELADALLHVP